MTMRFEQIVEQQKGKLPEKGLVTVEDLKVLAKFCETELGIECIVKT